MSTIRTIYHPVNGAAKAPTFPATDQHPDAVRYLVGNYYVDAIGGAPTQAEVDAVLQASVPAARTKAEIQADLAALTAEVEALK